MQPYQIISDSSCDLPDDLRKALGVGIVPYYATFDMVTYHKELIDLTADVFYDKIKESKQFPKTSLPPIQDYIDVFEPYLKEGKDVLCICLTAKFSGSFQSANNAKQILLESYPERRIEVFDSISVTGTQGLLVWEACKMQQEGMDLDTLLAKLEIQKNTNQMDQVMLYFESNNIKDEEVKKYIIDAVEGIEKHKAEIDEKKVYVGNDKLLQSQKIKAPSTNELGTIVYVAEEKTCLGYIVIADKIKDNAKQAINELKQKSHVKQTIMLTGDKKEIADDIAKQVEIDKVYSELLPQDKVEQLEIILKKQTAKEKVAFVGDGINDAPVLTRADIGIAMGALGSDAAIEAADVVIMDDDISKISTAISLSQRTIGIVKQNIYFAIGIKVFFLLLGALGLANMMEAVFADVGVSIIAILNSMRTLKVSNKKR